MKKNLLHILDIIGTPNALLPEYGARIFKVARPLLAKGEPVELDFGGLRHASTTFFHSSIGELYLAFPDKFERLVSAINMDRPDWKIKFEDALDLARNPRKVEDIRRAMEELLDA
ncbi:MAG: DUF4325 domain-containing protein [Haliscomenobacteraceae bacterium CHB4]|nr:hypothetical protein [Saprospiraceae bacterium]MCE7926526.1 DUF4325 domain-containing protein [Haliscomenobacteraceae bacterium CHB4]